VMERASSIVETWKVKSDAVMSNDMQAPVISKTIETIAVFLNDEADPSRVDRAISALNHERLFSFHRDENKDETVRNLTYGLVECIHVLLMKMKGARNSMMGFTQDEEDSTGMMEPLLLTNDSFDGQQERDESLDDQGVMADPFYEMANLLLPKVELFDEYDNSGIDAWNLMMKQEETNDDMMFGNENREGEMGESEDSNEQIKAVEKHQKKKRNTHYTSGKDLNCPKCELRTRSITGWNSHLRDKHSLTPAEVGVLLRCECGNESLRGSHKCTLPGDFCNFTVIRKGGGPIGNDK
ncbi:hypothetical protein PMAYCL1PPCAC_12774, partial [Pristionchus mayeri]